MTEPTEWVMVPREPTPAMAETMRSLEDGPPTRRWQWVWATLLSAAPTPPSSTGMEVVKEFEVWAEGRPARDTEIGRRMAAELTAYKSSLETMATYVDDWTARALIAESALTAQSKTIEVLEAQVSRLTFTSECQSESLTAERATVAELRAEAGRLALAQTVLAEGAALQLQQTQAQVDGLTAERDTARERAIEECRAELLHRAFLCHAHDDHGKGRERGLLDGAEYCRVLKSTEGKTT